MSLGGADGVQAGCGVSFGVSCLCRSGGGTLLPLSLQRVCEFFAEPFCQERQLPV